jgi:nucleoside-diphosphate-sugar epimerase
MTAILVTGASTPLGRALVSKLSEDARVSRVLGIVAPGETVDRPGDRVKWIESDLTRERDLRTLIFGEARDAEVSVVVHAAHHRAARDSGDRIRALNVESTRELLRLSERHPTIRRFVFRSHADVYEVRPERASIVSEDHPLEMSRSAPQWVRDRVEADLVVGLRMGMTELQLALLRSAECLAPESGSQLLDYLASNVCFAPLGFDPMLNVLSAEDLLDAIVRAVFSDARGIFNVPGWDTLPLSGVIHAAGRVRIPVPSPLIHPLYGLRAATRRTDFRYDQNYFRFHFGGVLNGDRARRAFGYAPSHPMDWSIARSAGKAAPLEGNGFLRLLGSPSSY